jgi:hypothetical protein
LSFFKGSATKQNAATLPHKTQFQKENKQKKKKELKNPASMTYFSSWKT